MVTVVRRKEEGLNMYYRLESNFVKMVLGSGGTVSHKLDMYNGE